MLSRPLAFLVGKREEHEGVGLVPAGLEVGAETADQAIRAVAAVHLVVAVVSLDDIIPVEGEQDVGEGRAVQFVGLVEDLIGDEVELAVVVGIVEEV